MVGRNGLDDPDSAATLPRMCTFRASGRDFDVSGAVGWCVAVV